MLRTNVAIWESDGITEVSSNRYVNNADDVSTTALGLTPGATYYISVDNNFSGYRGSFTLCLSDKADYDFYEGAYEITDVDNWCSADGEFTTVGATPDVNAASCWNTSPSYNRWFTFVAQTENATIEVRRGGSLGTILRINLALWEADGTTEVACSRYTSNADNVSIVTTGLIPGNTYYISVDNNFSGYRGTFTLCVDNINQTYYSINSGNWPDGNNWSLVDHTGPAAGNYPVFGDIAVIEGHEITVTGAENASGVRINANTAATELEISGGSLDVTGRLDMRNTGNSVSTSVSLTNGTLSINDSYNAIRSGGNAAFNISLNNSTISVNRDFTFPSTAGTTDNTISLTSGSMMTIGGEFTLTNSGGPNTLVDLDASSLTVSDNIIFSATSDNQVGINLSSSSNLYLGNSIIRGTPAYGNIANDGSSSIHYISDNNLQVIAASAGSGTGDVIDYTNLVINNTRVATPMLSLEGDVSITGTLTLLDGIVSTSSSAMLIIEDGGSSTAGSGVTFIDGPMRKIGAGDFVFPLGNGNQWGALAIANLTGDAATEFESQYFFSAYADVSNIRSPDPNGDMENVSIVEYWELNNAGTVSAADVSLYWSDKSISGIQDPPNLVVAHYNTASSEWENLGQDGLLDAEPGFVTVDAVTSFSPFTFGSLLGNTLPVELIFVDGDKTDNGVMITWATATEIDNDYFEIQRSTDGKEYQSIGITSGAGRSDRRIDYDFLDTSPLLGIVYYRIKQVDFDGTQTYSNVIRLEVEDDGLVLYPNPVSGNKSATLRLSSGESGIVDLRVIDILGQEIQVISNQFLPKSQSKIEIPTNKLISGVYIVEIYVDGIVYRRNLVVE